MTSFPLHYHSVGHIQCTEDLIHCAIDDNNCSLLFLCSRSFGPFAFKDVEHAELENTAALEANPEAVSAVMNCDTFIVSKAVVSAAA